jgi:hypothetical protein
VFPKDKVGQLSVPTRLAREIREYGEAIIAATQQSDVSDSLIANAGFKIVLRCDFPRDVDFASKLMQLDPKTFPRLPLGHAIARFPVRHYQPFLFTFAAQPLKNVLVTDAMVADRYTQTPVIRNLSNQAFTEKEEMLLRDVGRNPISAITQRYMRLGWNPKTGHALTRRLLARKLVTFEAVSTPTARVKILTLTTDGRAHLHDQGIELPRRGRGGIEHEYWRHKIKQHLTKQGYDVREEYCVSDSQAVDLRATKQQRILYIEVETGKSDIAANLKKCAALDGTVIFFFTDARLSERQQGWPPHVRRLTPTDLDTLC